MPKIRFCALLAMLAIIPGVATAQDPVANLQAKVTEMYSKTLGEALPSLMQATADIEEARGNKEKAALLRASAEDAKKGASKTDKKEFDKVMTQASSTVDSLAASLNEEAATLSDDQKDIFVRGAAEFVVGSKETVGVAGMVPELMSAVEGVSSVRNPMQLGKIKGLVDVANMLSKAIPQLVSANAKAATSIQRYASVNKITIAAFDMQD